jgi:hypothetical protein
MSAPTDDFQNLLALRDAINASIDTYVSLTPEERSQKPRVDKARQQIWSTATKLASETVNPMQEATLLAFMVGDELRMNEGFINLLASHGEMPSCELPLSSTCSAS